MLGFVTIVKYIGAEQKVIITSKDYDKDNKKYHSDTEVEVASSTRSMEKIIRENRIHGNHFTRGIVGEPLNKYVYYDDFTREYNMIYLYENGELGVIEQFEDYLNFFEDESDVFPEKFINSKYGSSENFDIKFRPIQINDVLLSCLRTCQYLGHMRYANKKRFNSIDISTKEDMIEFAKNEKVDENWKFTKNPPKLDRDEQINITNSRDFVYYISEKYGQGLNKGDRKLSDLGSQNEWNFFNLVEDDLRDSLENAKKMKFSDSFFDKFNSRKNLKFNSKYFE